MTIDWSRMVPAETRAAAGMARARAAAHRQLAEAVALARTRLITDLPGQSMIYLAKEAEARAWVAGAAPDPADYPLLSAETGITAETPDQLAQIWLHLAGLWRGEAARLEALRLSAAAAIDAAETPGQLDIIRNDLLRITGT